MKNQHEEHQNKFRQIQSDLMNEVDKIVRELACESKMNDELIAERENLIVAVRDTQAKCMLVRAEVEKMDKALYKAQTECNAQKAENRRLQTELDKANKALTEKQAECEALKTQLEKADKMLGAVRSAIGADGQQMSFNAPVGQQIAHVDNIIVQQHGNN